MEKQQQTNLEDLTRKLSAQCTSGSDKRSEASAMLAENLPLAHSTTSLRSFQDIASCGCLLSTRHLVEKKKIDNAKTEERLGTAEMLFTYCGAVRLPHAKGCALLFEPKVEQNSASGNKRREATPFDSGGIVKVYMPGADQRRQRKFLEQYTLPVPKYRTLLGKFMACYFCKNEDYVNGVQPKTQPPWINNQGSLLDARAWSFEVRFEGALSTEKYIEAVIVDRAARCTDIWFRKWLHEAETNNIQVRYYDVTENEDDTVERHDWLARAVAAYILDPTRQKPKPNGAAHEDAH